MADQIDDHIQTDKGLPFPVPRSAAGTDELVALNVKFDSAGNDILFDELIA